MSLQLYIIIYNFKKTHLSLMSKKSEEELEELEDPVKESSNIWLMWTMMAICFFTVGNVVISELSS